MALNIGTMGDVKPVVILAVMAARTSILPVTLVVSERLVFHFLGDFITYTLGKNQQILRIINLKEFDPKTMNDYISFGIHSVNCLLDFGDNASQGNRFVSCFLSNRLSDKPQFGSLFLPLDKKMVSNTRSVRILPIS